MQLTGRAARVRQARDRVNRAPEALVWAPVEQDGDDRLEAVALAIDRVPERHEATRLGEEQKQDSVQHRERLLPEHGGWLAPPMRQRVQENFERIQNAGAERPADANAVMTRERYCPIEEIGKRVRVRDGPQHGLRFRFLAKQGEIELEEVP